MLFTAASLLRYVRSGFRTSTRGLARSRVLAQLVLWRKSSALLIKYAVDPPSSELRRQRYRPLFARNCLSVCGNHSLGTELQDGSLAGRLVPCGAMNECEV